jgi:ferredoxin/flavodoxin
MGYMANQKIALVYFSATNVTRTYAGVIAAELHLLGCEVLSIDITSYASRQKALPSEGYDGFIFGFPVFSDFAPSVINEWIPTLHGNNMKCSMFFTYGARSTGYAHFHTRLLLEKAGFRVQFSAEFLGPHSYNVAGWHILPDRPNEHDIIVAREFAALTIERLKGDAPDAFILQKPCAYNEIMMLLQQQEKRKERSWCNPVRFVEECSMCRLCETECPSLAFSADTGLSDPSRCIECMHCMYICPDKVLKVDDRMKNAYYDFLNDWHLTEKIMDNKVSKIITKPWEASF